jgi:hypothetical protein
VSARAVGGAATSRHPASKHASSTHITAVFNLVTAFLSAFFFVRLWDGFYSPVTVGEKHRGVNETVW